MNTLVTERLILEPWHEKRRERWIALASDPRVTQWIGGGEPWDSRRSNEQFEWMLDHWHKHRFGWRSAVDKRSGAWLGFVGLNYVPPNAVEIDEGEVEIGWWLHPQVWGRGLATEGATSVRDEAFDALRLPRIVSRHHAGNPASGRIMEKLGMTFCRDATGRHGEAVRIYELERRRWETFGPGAELRRI